MDAVDAAERPHCATGTPQLSAATATPRQRGTGIALMLASSASSQAGAALGAMAFPAIGPVGVVAIRQFVTALVLTPIVRPRLRGLRRDQWWPILGLVVVFSIMNLSLYAAIDRIGLALAVTLEFLGPLTVAIISSRRVLDLAGALLAGVGVVVLTNPGPTTDVLGIALALLAATAWGWYILLNRTLGRRLPGLHGTAVASLVTAATWSPVAVAWFAFHTPTMAAVALAVACGLMSSIAPYVADLLALRRVPAQDVRHVHQHQPGMGSSVRVAAAPPGARLQRVDRHRADRPQQRRSLRTRTRQARRSGPSRTAPRRRGLTTEPQRRPSVLVDPQPLGPVKRAT